MQIERRQMGAVLVVERARTGVSKEQFFLNDYPKIEVAAPFTSWRTDQGPLLSYPAGGRDVASSGSEETVSQTVARELYEELSEAVSKQPNPETRVLFGQLGDTSFDKNSGAEQLLLPFLVGQINFAHQILNMLAATSLRVQFDSLPREVQCELEKAVNQKAAQFVKPAQVVDVDVFDSGLHLNSYSSLFRVPSVATAVWWWMQDSLSSEIFERVASESNAKTQKFIMATAQTLQLAIKNGAWGKNGRVATELLNETDAKYLGVTQG